MDNATTKNPRHDHVTDYEATAKRILEPLYYVDDDVVDAVAAALAQRDAEIARLKGEVTEAWKVGAEVESERNDLRTKLAEYEEGMKNSAALIVKGAQEQARLSAKLAGAERERDYFDTERQLIMARELRLSDEHEKLKADCDAAYVRGLERAKELAGILEIADAIAAEIANVNKLYKETT